VQEETARKVNGQLHAPARPKFLRDAFQSQKKKKKNWLLCSAPMIEEKIPDKGPQDFKYAKERGLCVIRSSPIQNVAPLHEKLSAGKRCGNSSLQFEKEAEGTKKLKR